MDEASIAAAPAKRLRPAIVVAVGLVLLWVVADNDRPVVTRITHKAFLAALETPVERGPSATVPATGRSKAR